MTITFVAREDAMCALCAHYLLLADRGIDVRSVGELIERAVLNGVAPANTVQRRKVAPGGQLAEVLAMTNNPLTYALMEVFKGAYPTVDPKPLQSHEEPASSDTGD
jgi:hypothetical protein